MVDVLRTDTPTPPDQRITELFAWIAEQPDGGEGVISFEIPGIGHMPLVTSQRRIAEGPLREVAQRVKRLDPEGLPRLLHFRLVGEVA